MTSTDQTSSEQSSWPSLQVDEDMRFQRRFWAAHRIGWIVMTLLVIAALLGLFSVGPFSTMTTRDPAGLVAIEYERFQRLKAPQTFRMSLAKLPEPGETASLRLSQSLVDAFEIESIQPEPDHTALAGDALVFTFRLDDPDRPGAILFSTKPQLLGSVLGEIGLGPTHDGQVRGLRRSHGQLAVVAQQ